MSVYKMDVIRTNLNLRKIKNFFLGDFKVVNKRARIFLRLECV